MGINHKHGSHLPSLDCLKRLLQLSFQLFALLHIEVAQSRGRPSEQVQSSNQLLSISHCARSLLSSIGELRCQEQYLILQRLNLFGREYVICTTINKKKNRAILPDTLFSSSRLSLISASRSFCKAIFPAASAPCSCDCGPTPLGCAKRLSSRLSVALA